MSPEPRTGEGVYVGYASPGAYTFYTTSDDGSALYVDGALIVDNDGLHAPREAFGAVTLTAGFHEVVVTMFEGVGGQALSVDWMGPDTNDTKVALGPVGLFRVLPEGETNEVPLLVGPEDRNDRTGTVVTLDLEATDPDGDWLYFDALGLPLGLSLDHDTGRISGALSEAGVSEVTASASDGPAVSVVSFTWTVVPPPCGDGTVDSGEDCDDGNRVNGDGCSDTCETEPTMMPDGGVPDGGAPDGGVPDSGVVDGGTPDDGGSGSGGGGCSVQRAPNPTGFVMFVWLVGWLFVRRRRALAATRRPVSNR